MTIKEYTDLAPILDALGQKFEAKNAGLYLYKRSLWALDGLLRVLYDGEANQGSLCIQMSGQACRIIEQAPDFPGWRQWLSMWRFKFNARFTRFDVAIDDVDAVVPFERVYEAYRNRDYSSYAKSGAYHERRKNGVLYRTVEIGARQSTCMFRAYEKGKLLGDAKEWVRFEFQFNGDKAAAAVERYTEIGLPSLLAACRGEVDFTDPFDCRDVVSRREVAPWWVALMEGAKERIVLGAEVVTSLAHSFKQVRKQWGQRLFVMWEAQGFDLGWLAQNLMEVPAKISDRNRALRELARGKIFSENFVSFAAVAG